jgi:hypothetical protein
MNTQTQHGYSDFQAETIQELHAMRETGMCSAKALAKAIALVEKDADEFSDDSGMSYADAADLALALAKVN